MSKRCIGCQNVWPVVAFKKSVNSADGLRDYCVLCDRNYKKRKKKLRKMMKRRREIVNSRRARRMGCQTFVISNKDMRKLFATRCRYEGPHCRGYLTIEHIVPLSRGGSHGIGNLTRLCEYHNSAKNNRVHTEYIRYTLLYPPRPSEPPHPHESE